MMNLEIKETYCNSYILYIWQLIYDITFSVIKVTFCLVSSNKKKHLNNSYDSMPLKRAF